MRMMLDILKALGDACKAIQAVLQLLKFLKESTQKKKAACDESDHKRKSFKA